MAALAPTAGEIGHALSTDLLRDVQLEAATACTELTVLYEDGDGTWQVASNDDTTTDFSALSENQIGIALMASPAGGRTMVLCGGVLMLSDDDMADVTGLVHAETYVVGADGAIEAIGDQSSGDVLIYVGFGVDFDTDEQYGADALVVKIIPTGQQKP